MRSTDRANPYTLGAPSASGCRAKRTAEGRPANMHPHGALSGGWNETHTWVIPISVLCCIALFPAKSMVPPYSASLHRLRHPVFEFVSFLVIFVLLFYDCCYPYWPSFPALLWVSCVVLASPAGHRNARFFFSSVSLLSSFLFVYILVFSFLFSSFLFFSFFLLSFLFLSFLFFPFLSSSFRLLPFLSKT